MNYAKTILCLANSRKPSGRCIAGKELSNGKIGAWIRPVSARPSEEISEEERCYEDGHDPEVLDVIQVPMIEARPKSYQSENHLIDADYYWTRVGQGTWKSVLAAVDQVNGSLWPNCSSSYNGINDRVPDAIAQTLTGSLYLIAPAALKIHIAPEGPPFAHPKRKVRASFTFAGAQYKLSVTDPAFAERYLQGQNGTFPIEDALLCVSLGELWDGYAYKLVAAVITPP